MESKLTILLLLVLGAGLAFGSWYLLSDDSSPEVGKTLPGPTPPEHPAAPKGPPAGVAGEVGDFAPISTDAFEDEELFAAGGEPRQVLVVDRDRQPVAGAEVTLKVRDRGRLGTPGRTSRGVRTLRMMRTDEDGFAPLNPLPRDRLTIEARTEGTFGFAAWVDDADARRKLDLPEGADALVILEPIRHLEVAVVDHLGAPAPHVEVGVAATARAAPGRRSDLERVLRTGPSLGNLRSPAPDAVLGIPITTAQRGLYRAESVQIMAVLPGMDPASTTARLEPEGTTRAVLTLPPTVLLHLSVRETGDQELVTFPVEVRWTVQTEDAPTNGRELRRLLELRHSLAGAAEIEEGHHSIGGFAPGATLSFEVRAPERVPWKREVVLPSTELQVEIDLEAGPVRPFLTARLLEPDGRPAERLSLQARIESSRGDIAVEKPAPGIRSLVRGGDDHHRVRTDDDGNVRIPVEPGTIAFVKLTDTSAAARTHRKGLVAEIPLPELQPGEVRDLGEVTLDRGALLVTGVVMAQDVPENDAIIEARRIGPAPGGTAPRGRFRGTLGKVESGAEGKFSIYGSSEITGEIQLRARSGELRSATVTVPMGSTDVILPLIETGSLRGRVVLADPALRSGISLRLASQDGESSHRLVIPRRRATSEKPGAGAFEFKRLMPGLYDLTVLVGNLESTTVRDLEVKSGEESTPAAVEELVVGGEFLRARVEVRTPRGEPIVRARVLFDDRSEAPGGGRMRTRRGVQTDRQGIAEMVVRSGALVALTIEAKGYATQRTSSAAFPLVVTLEPGLEVTLEFSDPLPQVEGISRYRIALEPRNADPGVNVRRRSDGRTFRSGDRGATFENVQPGTYLVRLQPLPPGMGRGDPEKWREFFKRAPVDLGEISIPSAPPLKWRVSRDTSQLAEQVRAFLDS